jgi:hypothetical protein
VTWRGCLGYVACDGMGGDVVGVGSWVGEAQASM